MSSPARTLIVSALVGLMLIALGGAASAPATAAKGKKKVTACVIKKGEDKGLMRFAPKGKCKGGEKKLTWNKKGKKGKRGKPGAAGAQGPAGPAGSQGLTEQFQATVTALCTQLTAVTSQLTAVQTALGGLGLSGAIPPLGLIVPSTPPALGPFACP